MYSDHSGIDFTVVDNDSVYTHHHHGGQDLVPEFSQVLSRLRDDDNIDHLSIDIQGAVNAQVLPE